MIISANLLSAGLKIIVGQSKYEVLKVSHDPGKIKVIYKNNKGIEKIKVYGANAKVKIH